VRRKVIELKIQDNGPGISRDAIKKIYNPFFTTKTKGTGLGLSISKNLMERHGGTLEVKNADDGGCLVMLTIPRSESGGTSSTDLRHSSMRKSSETN